MNTGPASRPDAKAQPSAHPYADKITNYAKDSASAALRVTKPLLRGWLHLGTTPLALAASIVLTVLAPTPGVRIACAVFLTCSLLLFGISALYHRGNWSAQADRILRSIDHSNIFLLIAGSYTPIVVSLFDRPTAILALSVVWAGAAIGIAMSVFWPTAPRWLYTPLYVILGWVAVWFFPQLWAGGGAVVVWLLVAGGLCYTLGAVAYGFKRPNPWPTVFGFHEVFHAGTVAGWTCICIGAYFAVLA